MTLGNMNMHPEDAAFVAGRQDNYHICTYPVAGDASTIEQAADNLFHMQGVPADVSLQVAVEDPPPDSGSRRGSRVRIQMEDHKRLLQGHNFSFLNDSLVDFWMKWCVARVALSVCPWWWGTS
jgi:hypothetical protein